MATEMTTLRAEVGGTNYAIWIANKHLRPLEKALVDVATGRVEQTVTINGHTHSMEPEVAEAFIDAIDELE